MQAHEPRILSDLRLVQAAGVSGGGKISQMPVRPQLGRCPHLKGLRNLHQAREGQVGGMRLHQRLHARKRKKHLGVVPR